MLHCLIIPITEPSPVPVTTNRSATKLHRHHAFLTLEPVLKEQKPIGLSENIPEMTGLPEQVAAHAQGLLAMTLAPLFATKRSKVIIRPKSDRYDMQW